MKNNKGMSITALVVTIIIMIILASITAPILSSIIDDSLEQDARVELKNVQTVIESAKALIMTDQFSPNQKYVISYDDLLRKFGRVLTEDEVRHIKEVNEDSSQKAPYKYYLMDRDAFKDEFSSDFNVNGIRENRQYLINYMDTLVLMNYGDTLLSNKTEDAAVEIPDVVRGDVKVSFYPNGNFEWAQQQATIIRFDLGEGTNVTSVQYVWSQDVTEPDESIYPASIGSVIDGQTISTSLVGETGNGWYVWVLVKYNDLGNEKVRTYRSDPFYIDNIPPSAIFTVDEISR